MVYISLHAVHNELPNVVARLKIWEKMKEIIQKQ